jgi:energy-coupling factor transport system ATP-binding protein
LKVEPGQWVLVSGPSGCGKSTLAKSVSGIIPHAAQANMKGSLRVGEIETQESTLPDIAQHVGMVFQNPGSQLFHLRVEDEIAFGPRNLGFDEEQVRERTGWALEATGIQALRDRRPSELSGGQKQCVAIASVLAMRPKILVLDEPTASLDLPNTFKVLETLNVLRDHYGITILMIEHRVAAAMQRVDRVILMDKGRIVVDGTPEDVFADRNRRDDLGLRRPAEHPMTPWKGLIQPNGKRDESQQPLLSLEGIYAGYNGKNVLEDISLSIYPGDFMALVGANGVGKSTLALVAAGLLKPRQGKVKFGGGKQPQPGLDVGLLFQDAANQLFTDAVGDEVAFGPNNFGCFQKKNHLQILHEADLFDLIQRRPSNLSVGQQQRTALASCLSLRPQLVILDEPTLGQDWKHLQKLMDYLQKLNRDGTAVLLISHDYKLVHRYANRMVLIEDGKIKINGILNNTEKSYEI